MRRSDYKRWQQLVDRQACGEPLTPEEQAFCEEFAARHEVARAELETYDVLAHLDDEEANATRASEDAVLTAFRQQRVGVPPAVVGPSRRLRWVWASVAAAAALSLSWFGGASWFGSAQQAAPQAPQARAGRAELMFASGEVTVGGRPVEIGSALLSAGDVVRVARGRACLAVDPEIDVCLAEHSRLRVGRVSSADKRVELLAGQAVVALEPQPPGARFSVVAGEVASTALGTRYAVGLSADGAVVETAVLEGEVVVGGDARSITVRPHEKVRVRRDGAGPKPAPSAVGRSAESRWLAQLEVTQLWREPRTGTLLVDGGDQDATLAVDDIRLGPLPFGALVPVGSHRVQVRRGEQLLWERDVEVRAGETVRLVAPEQLASAAQAPQPASVGAAERERSQDVSRRSVRRAPSAQQLLARAHAALKDGRWSAAARAYRALRAAHRGTPEARMVTVRLAQLELEHADRPGRALALLDDYLAAGAGTLAQEALYTRVRALRALGLRSRERAAIEGFLGHFPRSFEARALRERLASLSSEAAEQPR